MRKQKMNEYVYFVRNDGEALDNKKLLFKKVGDQLFDNATSNESTLATKNGWIDVTNMFDVSELIPISTIIAETIWPNLCKVSPRI